MRRPPRQKPIPAAIKTLPSGTAVEVTLDDGSIEKTATRSDPWELGDGTWVVMLEGRIGGYDLARVSVPAKLPEGPPVAEMTATEVLAAASEILSLGDMTDRVRAVVVEDGRWGRWDGNSWEHPMVIRWGQLSMRAAELIKESGDG
jgi:hypothetical protein